MKFIILLIFLTFTLLASQTSNNLEVQILEKIITEISINNKMHVWSDNKEILAELKRNNRLIATEHCEEATILILEKKNSLMKKCKNKYIFVLNYELLSEIPESFGALFWKKGRPNIVLINPRIKAQSIQVSNDLKPYLEEKVW